MTVRLPPNRSGRAPKRALSILHKNRCAGLLRSQNSVGDFLRLEIFGNCLPGIARFQCGVGTQRVDRRLEVFEGVEALVDAGESQVGDLVEFAQRFEDAQTHLVGIDLGDPFGPNVLFDLLRELRQVVVIDRTPWQALRTPDMIFCRENSSVTPERLITERLVASMVVKRRPQ